MSHPLAGIKPARPDRDDDSHRDTVPLVSRQEFLREWKHDYAPGQHVTFIGPTQRGKTTLAIQLLGESISPEHKCVILAGKPPKRDKTMAAAAQKLNLRIIEEWPPEWRPGDRKRNGYVLRPRQSLKDIKADNENLRKQYSAALIGNYSSSKPVITVVDEAHHVQNDLSLKREYEAPLMRGAPDNAVWSLIQRGRFMSYLAYDAPEHIFIFYDPDRSNQARYSDIGGVDPRWLTEIIEDLKTYRTANGQTISQCVYIRRSGPAVKIVDTK